MAHTSPVYGFRIPDLTDSPNGPVQISNAVLDIEAKFVAVDAAAAADDVTVAALPRGKVGGAAVLSGTAITTAEVIGPETATCTVVSGRRYRITHVRSEAVAGGSTIITARYRVANAGTVTTAGTLISSRVNPAGGAFGTVTFVTEWVATFSGTATFGVGSLVNGGGTGPVDGARNRDLYIDDIGL